MNFADAKLLLEFATLQARIAEDHGALSIDPVALAGSPRVRLTQTKGYRDLRAFFERLSPRAREGFRRQLRMQIDGVRAVLKRCAETGERPSLADLEISVTDVETGLPADGRCAGSGAGITEPVDERIGCQRCMASWHQNDIGFKIPEHQEQKMNKVDYVKRQGQTRSHHCHWPGCTAQVPPAMWGCKAHWFKLPKALRDRIWRAYVPGQEIDMSPSAEYLKVADDVQRWIREHP